MSKKRFEEVYSEIGLGGVGRKILKDKETGVQYLFSAEIRGCGLTVLVDKEGKPLVDFSHEGEV